MGLRHGGAEGTVSGPKAKSITIPHEFRRIIDPPKKATVAKRKNKPGIYSSTSRILGLLVGQEIIRGDREVRERVRETRGDQREIPLSAASQGLRTRDQTTALTKWQQ